MVRIKKKLQIIIMNTLVNSILITSKFRIILYKFIGLNISKKGTFIHSMCLFNGFNVEIGQHTFINYKCIFDNECGSKISIGNNCMIGMEVLFCTSSHKIGNYQRRGGRLISAPITVEDGCWIGSRTTILPGITIGNGCVIGAGSLVNKNCKPNGIYVGVPARRIKELPIDK
ncbi:acyltransferase [Sporolactobacillus vineae]|uniref:acyltransferase n=1 Tax=Sporolactobacillus vineae TaxID=444463 RepID=UPI0002884F70|nr:DapH/DapD/GlmU-related protein [Sporolactobacillus vineae]